MTETGQLLDSILDRSPSHETLVLLFEDMKSNGRYEDMLRYFAQNPGVLSESLRLNGLMTEACLKAGLLEQARDSFQKLSALMAKVVLPGRELAHSLIHIHRHEEAIKILQQYLTFHPEDEAAARLLQQSLALASKGIQETKGAEKVSFKEGDGAPMPEGFATPTMAELYLQQGQRDQAIRIYQKIVELHPEDRDSRKRLQDLIVPDEETRESSVFAEKLQASPTRTMIAALEDWLPRIREIRHA